MAEQLFLVHPATSLTDRYSSCATAYAELWSPVILPMGRRLVQALPIQDAAQVLDVGTGVGALILDIQAASPHALVVGIDGAIGMLRVAQSCHAIPLALMDIRRLGFPPGSFDAAVLAFVLFHLPDPIQGLIEIGRTLRPGGAIGVTAWATRPSFAASEVWDDTFAAFGIGPDPAVTADSDDQMDTPAKLAALLAAAGFTATAAWSEPFEHRWDIETLIAQRTGWGSYQRRLEPLDPEQRAICLACIRERLERLAPDDFLYRPEIVFATGQWRSDRDARSPP